MPTCSSGDSLSALVDTARSTDGEILVWTQHGGETQLVCVEAGEVVGEIEPPAGVAFARGAVAFGAGVYLFYLSAKRETWAYSPSETTWMLVDAAGRSDCIDRFLTYDSFNGVFAIITIDGTFHTLRLDRDVL